MLLQQCLLRQDGIFNDQLEQAGDVMRIQMVRFAKVNQAFQQIALPIDIAYRTMRRQLCLSYLNGQRTAFGQQ